MTEVATVITFRAEKQTKELKGKKLQTWRSEPTELKLRSLRRRHCLATVCVSELRWGAPWDPAVWDPDLCSRNTGWLMSMKTTKL